MSEILTVKEAAALLKTSRQQIRRMIQNGELPAVKVGREWRISRNALLDYLGFPY
ncbi:MULTISPECIES: helix-turn-helix domain-containing protein [unclassified Flavonifractor]|uniref:helix-turn-helix domain-containing protein n=1 Tax=unclassified Flavonifractor TaxID=2629267 RepID=UPI000B3A6890|nr:MULTISPECIES: helix-turn-helix domain-containing protein [unclassified Flavonifractor]OUN11531.1 DNA-binding protein [Flavonifractor sp. An91]OUN81974.1 DNA-binding protein [Flavonifractor sp. An52]OUO11309.1 DNA-binding protein [Flavonifractor sp. An4]OUQ58679.1 DNA-binding protein [Flavonifractor sp. An112]